VTGPEPAPGGSADDFVAPDYDAFADAPIVMGDISIHTADVPGTRVILADFGDLGMWDGAETVKTLARIVDEHRRMMGGRLPFDRYVFLNALRGGAGLGSHDDFLASISGEIRHLRTLLAPSPGT